MPVRDVVNRSSKISIFSQYLDGKPCYFGVFFFWCSSATAATRVVSNIVST